MDFFRLTNCYRIDVIITPSVRNSDDGVNFFVGFCGAIYMYICQYGSEVWTWWLDVRGLCVKNSAKLPDGVRLSTETRRHCWWKKYDVNL